MAIGPGKYNDWCTEVREATEAQAVIVMVLNGNRGTGFSVQAHEGMSTTVLADLLMSTANLIRRDGDAN